MSRTVHVHACVQAGRQVLVGSLRALLGVLKDRCGCAGGFLHGAGAPVCTHKVRGRPDGICLRKVRGRPMFAQVRSYTGSV